MFSPDRLFVIAGPCVIESSDQCMQIGQHMKRVCDSLGITYIFKASFDKANRSSGSSFRGPGIVDGLVVLERIRKELGVPVLTDIHEPEHAAIAAKMVDILQIPAFMARQTDLLLAAAHTGKTINVKKGQFMSPAEMANAVAKIREGQNGSGFGVEGSVIAGRGLGTGNQSSASPLNPDLQTLNPPVLLTERGTFFGYNRLVNDFTGLHVMKQTGCPVVFDITHSTQQPAGQGTQSGGNPHYAPLLARAAIATGCVDGLFLECHPDPKNAKSDPATTLGLEAVEPLLRQCQAIFNLRQ